MLYCLFLKTLYKKPTDKVNKTSRRKSDWIKKALHLKKEHPCGYNSLRDFFFLNHFNNFFVQQDEVQSPTCGDEQH